MNVERVFIGYGSESGNARDLAQRLQRHACLQQHAPTATALNDLALEHFTAQDLLLIVTSSFGDGEPPANAERFLEQITHIASLTGLRYAIFGLGDTAYPTFCGFSKALDLVLAEKGATAVINRVDADSDFEAFFNTWATVVDAVLQGDAQAGKALHLRVTAYGEHDAYPAKVIQSRRLNQSAPYASHIRLDIEGSGIRYRAGDNLYVLAENEPALLAGIAEWLGDERAVELLAGKELRQLGKPLLRDLAKASANDELKTLLKVSNRKPLEQYLRGKDLLDLLENFCEPSQFDAQALADLLPASLPRAYSIASHSNPGYVDLCIREVAYTLAGRERTGMATGFLTGAPTTVKVFARSNPRFHLPDNVRHPVILIGTGTGIAPLIGLLEQLETQAQRPTACLVFGDRRESEDFLYRERITHWQAQGLLSQVLTAFSRDSESRYYVQHALMEHGHAIWALLVEGAHVYLCGNKANLDAAIEAALVEVARAAGRMETEAAEAFVRQLQESGRIHKELY
jgi:sulfite reductase (NADPH) flavoprotein alpha-component